jgi:hypothetical protein
VRQEWLRATQFSTVIVLLCHDNLAITGHDYPRMPECPEVLNWSSSNLRSSVCMGLRPLRLQGKWGLFLTLGGAHAPTQSKGAPGSVPTAPLPQGPSYSLFSFPKAPHPFFPATTRINHTKAGRHSTRSPSYKHHTPLDKGPAQEKLWGSLWGSPGEGTDSNCDPRRG